MQIAYAMVLAAALLPYVTVGLAKAGGSGYDNARPRDYTERLAGWRRRAEWAHRNHFEAFAPFAAGVLVAGQRGTAPGVVDALAAAFVVFRIGYTAAYLADWPTLRSALWALALACVIALFVWGG